jgi:hypothetical protein
VEVVEAVEEVEAVEAVEQVLVGVGVARRLAAAVGEVEEEGLVQGRVLGPVPEPFSTSLQM